MTTYTCRKPTQKSVQSKLQAHQKKIKAGISQEKEKGRFLTSFCNLSLRKLHQQLLGIQISITQISLRDETQDKHQGKESPNHSDSSCALL